MLPPLGAGTEDKPWRPPSPPAVVAEDRRDAGGDANGDNLDAVIEGAGNEARAGRGVIDDPLRVVEELKKILGVV